MKDWRFVDPRLVVTADGSHSFLLPTLGEHYHSTNGAIVEARTVFIRYGYEHAIAYRTAHLRILEVGFGTGLNALLPNYSRRHGCSRPNPIISSIPAGTPSRVIAKRSSAFAGRLKASQ